VHGHHGTVSVHFSKEQCFKKLLEPYSVPVNIKTSVFFLEFVLYTSRVLDPDGTGRSHLEIIPDPQNFNLRIGYSFLHSQGFTAFFRWKAEMISFF
jgi:hypothetical protein